METAPTVSELGFDPYAVPVSPAATVMLMRDSDGGPEVFMLRRTAAAVFAAGMYVFPGGKVDAADGGRVVEACCDGRSDVEASRLLTLPSGGLSYWVAAIRECFEEAGVLLARHAHSGEVVAFGEPSVAARFGEYRLAVHAGRLGLVELCEREELRLITDSIGYVSHWITPMGQRRRFDARFFVARAPQAQDPLHDDHETVDSLWVRPVDALDRFQRGELGMFSPTVSNLQFLETYRTAAEAVAAAGEGGVGAIATAILPKVRVDPEGKVIELLMPGHDDYDLAPGYDVVG